MIEKNNQNGFAIQEKEASPGTEALIKVRGLSIDLGEFAVHDANVEVPEGEYFVLLGPTGAGKTVLLECIAGLHKPHKGDIFVAGERVNDIPPEQRGLGYLPQDYALFPHLNVAQNIGFGMRLRKKPASEINKKIKELSSLLGISHLLHRSPIYLSGGEQQRVSLARALSIEPKVLLLDEPLSALDEQTREGLCVELRRVHEELGTTTMHVSHNFEETLSVADRIGIIHQGVIQQIGTPEEIFRRPVSEFVARFVRCENIFKGTAVARDDGSVVKTEGVEFYAATAQEGEVLFTIRPEEIEVCNPVGAPGASIANTFTGRIDRIIDKGALMKLYVDIGVNLAALLSRRVLHERGYRLGDNVTVHFEPQAAHVIPQCKDAN